MSDKRFLHFHSNDLDLSALDLNFSHPTVNLVHRYVFTKLQVSMAFPFRENRKHGTAGRTGRVQRLTQS